MDGNGHLCVCVCCVCSAPGSVPLNVQARPLSSSSVVVQWNEPIEPNGIIQVSSTYQSIIVRPDVDQRSGQCCLPHVRITEAERTRTKT